MTTETGPDKPFCTSAAELAAAMQSEAWQSGVPVETSLTATFTGLDDVANTAPTDIVRWARNLRGGLERYYSSLDDIPAVGDPPDPARQQQARDAVARSQQALDDATPAIEQVTAFVARECPGTTLPPVTVPAPPGL